MMLNDAENFNRKAAGPNALDSVYGPAMDAYWAPAQLRVHQTSNGTKLCPGDLLSSGTLCGPEPSSHACPLELSESGKVLLRLPTGETHTFLEDGGTVFMHGHCLREGHTRIGFGECRTTVLHANPS